MISFVLPSPPSANNLFSNVPGRGRVRSERYRTWANAAGWELIRQGIPRKEFPGPIAIEIVTGNARQDIDNGIKALLDLLTDLAFIRDDKQVVDLRVTRGGKSKEAIVTVRAI